jgi:hypothetical protein
LARASPYTSKPAATRTHRPSPLEAATDPTYTPEYRTAAVLVSAERRDVVAYRCSPPSGGSVRVVDLSGAPSCLHAEAMADVTECRRAGWRVQDVLGPPGPTPTDRSRRSGPRSTVLEVFRLVVCTPRRWRSYQRPRAPRPWPALLLFEDARIRDEGLRLLASARECAAEHERAREELQARVTDAVAVAREALDCDAVNPVAVVMLASGVLAHRFWRRIHHISGVVATLGT